MKIMRGQWGLIMASLATSAAQVSEQHQTLTMDNRIYAKESLVNLPMAPRHCVARIGNAQPGWRKERSRRRHREIARRQRRNAGLNRR